MKTTIMNSRTTTRAAAASVVFTLTAGLTACGGEGSTDGAEAGTSTTNESPAEETAEPAQPAVESFPVGEPFGQAVWSVDIGEGEKTVFVRPDRVFVDNLNLDTRTIHAYTSEGAEAWTYELSGHEYPENAKIGVFDETVAVLEQVETEASGLDLAGTATRLTALSQEDGSVVAEEEISGDAFSINSFGSIVYWGEGEDTLSFVTETGEIVDVEAPDAQPNKAGLVNGIPFWIDRSNHVNTASWSSREDLGLDQSEFIGAEVLAVDNRQGLLVLQVSSGVGVDLSYYGVRAETGEVAYELSCPGYSHSDSQADIARNSPNGEYGVLESVWVSADEGQCFGGEDGQRSIELIAVDDNGTAYGDAAPGSSGSEELVVIPAGGEPEVSEGPTPVGIMNGDIAVHVNGSRTEGTAFTGATTISGNPIE